MKKHQLGLATILGAAAVCVASSSGSPGGYSSAPGESNCTACHSSFPLGSGSNTLTITTPASSAGLASIPVQVDLQASGKPRYGFEISVRDSAGSKVSAWQITDATNTKLKSGNVTHTSAGNQHSSWSMGWNQPAGLPAGPLTFYSAGLEGNGGGTSGDYVYTAQATMYQAGLSTTTTTWPLGTLQPLAISAPTRPNDDYIVAMSDGTTPTPIPGGFVLPVDLGSPLFEVGISNPAFFQGFVGSLDAGGNALAQVLIPNLPILSGFQLHFAFAAVQPGIPIATEVSNRVSVVLQ